jgi:Carboxypeptidase regulatory-like domain
MRRLTITLLILALLVTLFLLNKPTGTPNAPPARPAAELTTEDPPLPTDESAPPIDPRRTGRLRVRVATAKGPLENALLEVRPKTGPIQRLRTDENGLALFDAVPAGNVKVRAETDGFAPEETERWIPLGGLTVLELSFRPPRTLTGTVVGPEGVPVSDARVRIFEPLGASMDGACWEPLDRPLGEARTGPDGRFRAEGLRGSHSDSALFLVSAAGFRTTLYFGSDGIRVPLAFDGEVEGRVTDPAGRPIADARVVAVPATYPALWREDAAMRGSLWKKVEEGFVPVSTRTDATGKYRLAGLGRGEMYIVRFFADGFSFRELGGVRPPTKELDVILPAGGRVFAAVRDEGGHPIARALISVTGPWRCWFPGAETGSDGRATIGGLPFGRLYVRASAARHGQSGVHVTLPDGHDVIADLVLASDPRRGDADLPPVGDQTLEGHVLFPDGEPVSRGSVRVKPHPHRTRIEADGSFRIDHLPAGRFAVTADPYLGEESTASALLPSPPLTIFVPRRSSVRGRLALPPGAQAPGLVTATWPRGSTSFSWKTTADGACPFHLAADPGPCSIEFRADGFRPLVWRGEVSHSDVTPAGTLTFDVGRVLTGRVLDEDGVAVAGAEVGVGTPRRTTSKVRTGLGGEFRLSGIGPGPTSVFVVADGLIGADQSVLEDAGEIEFVLARGVRLEVFVMTDEGDAIRGAEVELHGIDPWRTEAPVVTGSAGVATFRVPHGTYRVTGRVRASITGREEESETKPLELEATRLLHRVVLVPR